MIDHDLDLVEPVLEPLLACLDGLSTVARGLHPPALAGLVAGVAASESNILRGNNDLEEQVSEVARAVHATDPLAPEGTAGGAERLARRTCDRMPQVGGGGATSTP